MRIMNSFRFRVIILSLDNIALGVDNYDGDDYGNHTGKLLPTRRI